MVGWILKYLASLLSVLWIITSLSTVSVVSASEIPRGFYEVADAEGVPVKLLYAIALNESQTKTNFNRRVPWVYTLNHKGKGFYFKTSEDLKSKILALLAKGETLFDVGIAQVNYHWHRQNFKTIDEMINPRTNLIYASRYLKSHYEQTGNWWIAVGKYHSPGNKKHALNYYRKVRKIWLEL